MKKEYRILFTSVGRRVELVQAFRKAARDENINLKIYAADMSENAPALYFCDEARKICRISDDNYIPALLALCLEEKIDLLIPTIDTDLLKLSLNRKSFEQQKTKVLISAPEMIQICRDKRYTGEFFESCGLHAPKAFDDYRNYNMDFPCFIKPKDGSSSINAFKVKDRQELEELSSKVADYVVQPFVEGTEYTVDIFCDFEGNPIFVTPRERVAVRSGEVLQTKIVEDEEITVECLKLIKRFKPCGPITVQLIKDRITGMNYYIEINPRFGGGAPLSIKAGADSAKALLLLLQDKRVKAEFNAAKEGKSYSRFDQSISITERRNAIIEVDNLGEIREYIKDKKAVIFDLDDTLYDECDYVRSGYAQVADYIAGKVEGLSKKEVEDFLYQAFEQKKPAIDVLFDCYKELNPEWKRECILRYREHTPKIELSKENCELLSKLRTSGKKIGIITDGRVEGQRNKLKALGLYLLIDEYIITDELAGNADVTKFRKPNPLAFQIMRERLGVEYDEMVYVGDNKAKDFQAPICLGMNSIWYHNEKGLYR